jgi:hypothetical protein
LPIDGPKVKPTVFFGAFALMICAGCTHLAPGRLGTNEDVSGAGMVFLESRWFAGGFGDGNPEWGGRNLKNDYSIGSHLPTATHVWFAVKLYPGQGPYVGDTKISFATRIGEAVSKLSDGMAISESTNQFQISQISDRKGGCQKTKFTFVVLQYTTKDQRVDTYGKANSYVVRHYLADVSSDSEGTLPTGSLFQMKIIMPEFISDEIQNRMIGVSEHFLTNDMCLNRKTPPTVRR